MIISILIPTYNRPKQLLIAINSCLDFENGNIEIIIGDDSQIALHNDFFNQINLPKNYLLNYFHRDEPLKQNKNVADLITKATGKYSLILHDDDYLLPNALKCLVETAKLQNKLRCVYFGKQILVDGFNKLIESNNLNKDYCRTNENAGLQTNPLKMALLQQVPSNSFLFPTLRGQNIGYRNYDLVGDACDFDFIVRLVIDQGCDLFFINENISAYTLSAESVSRLTNYNSIFYKYKIIEELKIESIYPDLYSFLIKKDLNVLCGYYVNNNLKRELKKLYFSHYYPLNKKLSLRGIYHLINCFN